MKAAAAARAAAEKLLEMRGGALKEDAEKNEAEMKAAAAVQTAAEGLLEMSAGAKANLVAQHEDSCLAPKPAEVEREPLSDRLPPQPTGAEIIADKETGKKRSKKAAKTLETAKSVKPTEAGKAPMTAEAEKTVKENRPFADASEGTTQDAVSQPEKRRVNLRVKPQETVADTSEGTTQDAVSQPKRKGVNLRVHPPQETDTEVKAQKTESGGGAKAGASKRTTNAPAKTKARTNATKRARAVVRDDVDVKAPEPTKAKRARIHK